MSDALQVREVEGWALGFKPNEAEPRIQDLDLGSRLGYGRPRDIIALIDRMESAGKLSDIHVCDTVSRTSMPSGGGMREETRRVRWLTEAQALKVAAKSETEPADALLDEMIRVFMLARRGELPGQAVEHTSARAALRDLTARALTEGDDALAHHLTSFLVGRRVRGAAPGGQLGLNFEKVTPLRSVRYPGLGAALTKWIESLADDAEVTTAEGCAAAGVEPTVPVMMAVGTALRASGRVRLRLGRDRRRSYVFAKAQVLN